MAPGLEMTRWVVLLMAMAGLARARRWRARRWCGGWRGLGDGQAAEVEGLLDPAMPGYRAPRPSRRYE